MATRLCLVVETTTRHRDQWLDTRLNIVEPILRELLNAGGKCELALVLVGVPGLSVEEVSSSPWTDDTQELRQWMDGIDFCGGGVGETLALAPALLAAASLFARPSKLPASPPPQKHCLVCVLSDPGPLPFLWPFPADCGTVKGCPTLATSMEMLRGLRRTGALPALCSRFEKPAVRPSLLWHLICLVAEEPIEWVECASKLAEAARSQPLLAGAHVGTPGNGLAFFPFWPEALRLLQAQNGSTAPALWSPAVGADPARPGAAEPPRPTSAPVGAGAAPAAPRAAIPGVQSASALQAPARKQALSPPQMAGEASVSLAGPAVGAGPFAPDAAQAAAASAAPGAARRAPSPGPGHGSGASLPDASPGGFWDVMNSELITGPSEVLPASFPTGPGAGGPTAAPPQPMSYVPAASPPLFEGSQAPPGGGYYGTGGPERSRYGGPFVGATPPLAPSAPEAAALSPPQYQQQYQMPTPTGQYGAYGQHVAPSPPVGSSTAYGQHVAPSPPVQGNSAAYGQHVAPSPPVQSSAPYNQHAAASPPVGNAAMYGQHAAPSPPVNAYAQQQQQQQPAPEQGAQQAQRGPPACIWSGPLRLSDRVRGTQPALLGTVDAYVAAEHAQRAALPVSALVVESFLMGPNETRKLAAAAARPGTLVLRLLPKDFPPHGEQALRRMATAHVTGQVDLGRGLTGFLSVQMKASSTGGAARPVLRLVAAPN